MKNSKEKIISDLKTKIKDFKSKIKKNKLDDNKEEKNDISNIQINLSSLKNLYKTKKEDNLNNNKDSINFLLLNNKENEKRGNIRSNSTSSNNFKPDKNYLDFDIDKLIKKDKKNKKNEYENNFISQNTDSNSKSIKSKTFVNFDDLISNKNINGSNLKTHTNKSFIKLNLSSKKSSSYLSSMSNTDRNYNYNNNKANKKLYEDNFSEPNIIINNTNHNYFQLQSKLLDFMNEIKLSNKSNKNIYKNAFSLTKPSIKKKIILVIKKLRIKVKEII